MALYHWQLSGKCKQTLMAQMVDHLRENVNEQKFIHGIIRNPLIYNRLDFQDERRFAKKERKRILLRVILAKIKYA